MSAYPTQPEAPRKDNLLGICHAIGEDFGFNPLFLRIALAVAMIFNAEWTLGAYAAMGVAVLASRLLTRRKHVPNAVAIPNEAVAPMVAEPAMPELALAA